jgi:hypothetical protein
MCEVWEGADKEGKMLIAVCVIGHLVMATLAGRYFFWLIDEGKPDEPFEYGIGLFLGLIGWPLLALIVLGANVGVIAIAAWNQAVKRQQLRKESKKGFELKGRPVFPWD